MILHTYLCMIPHGGEEVCACVNKHFRIYITYSYNNKLNLGTNINHRTEGPNYSMYSTNHVYLHRPNAFGFWQTRLHLCYETLKRVSNFSELA